VKTEIKRGTTVRECLSRLHSLTVVPRVFIVLMCLITVARAGEFNTTLSIGDAAPAWKDLEGVDGKKHALADLKDKNTVVVAFICNSCATVAAYEDRINALVEKFPKAAFVAINVNTIKEDQLPKMKERAEKKKYAFPYLYDPSQAIAKSFGARYTPEFFVLNKDRKIAYMGALDDKSNEKDVKEKYLDAALAGKPLKTETAAFGCRIRYVQMKAK
jgi:peroxiredoxin